METPYRTITSDPGFWKGCESCPLHSNLIANLPLQGDGFPAEMMAWNSNR